MIKQGSIKSSSQLKNETQKAAKLAARKAFKAQRAAKVLALTVEVEGVVYDADEDSQNRMTRAITALTGSNAMPWTMADNSVLMVTQTELKKALVAAGTAQSAVWHE
jgi:hypothetical protein